MPRYTAPDKKPNAYSVRFFILLRTRIAESGAQVCRAKRKANLTRKYTPKFGRKRTENGQVIALTCIKTVIIRSGKDLHYLYKGLLRDINRSKEDYSPFSNAYDIAQEAMLFLCQHIGEKLGDICITKYGKKTTIRSACYRCADNYLQKQYTRHFANTLSLDERITAESETTLDDEQKNDYTVVDGLISKMKLTAVEYETLSILMAGFTMLQISRILNVNRTTIWRRKMSLQRKYALVINSL